MVPPFAATSLALSIAFAPQEPRAAGVEVIGPAPRPSYALRGQVEKGEDEFLLFDVAYGVREVTRKLHDRWGELESMRAEVMRALLAAMRQRCAGSQDAATIACANVAAVAAALLAPAAKRPVLEPDQLDELGDVEKGGAGVQRFLPLPAAVDWKNARPVGGYAHDRHGWEGFAGLYRATIYLRRYFERWPEETRAAWRQRAATCRMASVAVAIDLARVAAQMPILFGALVDDSGVLQPIVAPDLAWLASHTEPAPIDDKLAALFAAVPMSSPKALSDGVLRLCHELTIARPADPLFGAMAPEQWQAKWRDAASFVYVGLREVDGLAATFGRDSAPPAPTVVVEPLPAVWEALRWLDRRDLSPGDAWQQQASWVDPVLEALALQQKGEDLPAKLNDRLRETLLTRFGDKDRLLGTTTRIDGVAAQVRRAVPQLVRVPIRWRGETKKALALRLFVEQEGPAGEWHAPPWGMTLQTKPGAPAVR